MTPLDLYQLYRDPIHLGWTPKGVSWGLPIVLGRNWSMPDAAPGEESVAATALFRGTGDPAAIDYTQPVGISLGKFATVQETALALPRPSDALMYYDLRAVNGAGIIGDAGDGPIRLRTDGACKLLIIPNPPCYISAEPLPNRRALVSVGYSPDAQAVEPTDVQLFAKQLTDPLDTSDLTGLYATPLTDDVTGLTALPFTPNRRRYRFTITLSIDGFYVFGAILRNATGQGNGNNVISNVIDMTLAGPPVNVSFAIQ